MKRKILFISILSLMLCGCNNQNEVNISEWMFSDDLTPYECEKILGTSSEKERANSTQYFWNDYEICDGYSGTLSLIYFDNQDPLSLNPDRQQYTFDWTSQCSEKEYDNIINSLKQYKHTQKYVSFPPQDRSDEIKKKYEDENGKKIKFTTDFQDENINTEYLGEDKIQYFTIGTTYKDEILNIQWSFSRSSLDH